MTEYHALNYPVLDAIKEQYEVLDIIDLETFSTDLTKLVNRFEQHRSRVFEPTQRLVVLHHDTDYYPDVNGTGFLVYNFLHIMSNLDISTEHCLFVTNHMGIGSEVAEVATQQFNITPPLVVETSQWYDFPDLEFMHRGITTNNIEYVYSCLNGLHRDHRVAMLSYLKHYNLLDVGMVSYHFN